PVVMLSTLTQAGASATLEALDLGAVDFVPKPRSGRSSELVEVRSALIRAVRAAAGSRVRVRRLQRTAARKPTPPRTGPPRVGAPVSRLVVIGSSTGGPPALAEVIPQLPATLSAAVLVVQHMPAKFTTSLAERLNGMSALEVREAHDGEALENGCVYVAPGSKQMALGRQRRIKISDAPPVHGVRPSVDFMLESVPADLAQRSVVAILTGMGKDGANGARRIQQLGGVVVAQDETTSVVYGMPRAVVELGVAQRVVALEGVATAIQDLL
ncbi:MAG: chemotaxis-specific protein-glutamate methyltransferase CheB, partial [Dehalococcoidia bacterium]